MRVFCLIIIACQLWACNGRKEKVDYIIVSSGIYNGLDSTPEYQCIVVNADTIVEIGNSDIANKYSCDSIIQTDGYVFPGFIDAHCHFSGYALDGYKCDLVGTKSYKEVIERLIAYEQSNKLGWIYGRGWDQNDWEINEYPNNSILDSLFPDKPVVLKRIDGHAILCNSKALEVAGINIKTKINGGYIENKNGQLTGILIDNAADPVESIIGKLPQDQSITYLVNAEKECYSSGLTSIVDCGVKSQTIELLKELYANGTLSIGNILLLSQDKITLDNYAENGKFDNGQLSITGIKLYADGALGSRGACLIEPYEDMHKHNGRMLADSAEMMRIATLAKANNLQLCTHAIGDSANRTILKLYSQILPKNNLKRWRIEHAQVVNYNDYMYYSDYSIIPSVQPTHAISDMPWVEKRIGTERLHSAYAYKNLLNASGTIALGTDFPVEAINPLATFYTAVARKDKEGNPEMGFLKENALSRFEAMKGMTIWAAYSVFQEKKKGSLQIGKQADIIILDKDIMRINESEILKTQVLYTFCKGKIKYKK